MTRIDEINTLLASKTKEVPKISKLDGKEYAVQGCGVTYGGNKGTCFILKPSAKFVPVLFVDEIVVVMEADASSINTDENVNAIAVLLREKFDIAVALKYAGAEYLICDFGYQIPGTNFCVSLTENTAQFRYYGQVYKLI